MKGLKHTNLLMEFVCHSLQAQVHKAGVLNRVLSFVAEKFCGKFRSRLLRRSVLLPAEAAALLHFLQLSHTAKKVKVKSLNPPFGGWVLR